MSVPTTLVFDINPPRFPSLDDVGGAALLDDEEDPPIEGEMPSSAMLNQWQRLIVALSKTVPALTMSMRFSAGAPSIDSFTAVGSNPILATFTVVDNATGDTSITWPADTFPPARAKPKAFVNGATTAEIAIRAITNGVRIVTTDNAGAAIDVDFTFDLM